MLNRLPPTIARWDNRRGMPGESFGMRSGSLVSALWITAAAAGLFAAPAAAQDAGVVADSAVAPPAAVDNDAANAPADTPLTPEEAAALGNALMFDPANLAYNKPAKPLRLPGLNDPTKLDVSRNDKPGAASTMVLNRPLASDWDAKVGADLNLAAAPSDGYPPSKPLAPAASQDSGAAWASVGVANLASVDARVDPGNDQGKLGTTLKRSIPVGSKFSVTLQDSYSVTETFAAPAPAPSDVPLMAVPPTPPPAAPVPQIWGSQKAVKFDVLTTGTTFGAGLTTASNDPVTHNTFSADQKLYGPLHVTTAVTDFGQVTASKSISAGLKLNW
jgi:hypothetical protein